MEDLFSGFQEKKEEPPKECQHCATKSGVYLMTCKGCAVRLIDDHQKSKRVGIAQYILRNCPSDVGEEVRKRFKELGL